MNIGLAFWILMLLWLAFGLWWNRTTYQTWIGGNALLFLLLVFLGWHDFGPPLYR